MMIFSQLRQKTVVDPVINFGEIIEDYGIE